MNTNQINSFILARTNEHKIILETLGEIEFCLKFTSRDEIINSLQKIIENFQIEIEHHHCLEEEVIFSSALEAISGKKIISTIQKLQKQHGEVEKTIEFLNYIICNFKDLDYLKIENFFKDLIIKIKKHSLIEVKELFPVLSSNPICIQLIKQRADNYASATSKQSNKGEV